MAKLYVPPLEEPVKARLPLVQPAAVVAVVPVVQLGDAPLPFTLKPVGRVAVEEIQNASKFCVYAVPVEVIDNCPHPVKQAKSVIKSNLYFIKLLFKKIIY